MSAHKHGPAFVIAGCLVVMAGLGGVVEATQDARLPGDPASRAGRTDTLQAGAWKVWGTRATQFRDIAMLSATDGWAVGTGGMILRWNGVSWDTVRSPSTAQLFGVHMLGPDDGWIMGYGGVSMHWDGLSWQLVPTHTNPSSTNLFDSDWLAPDDGWAVGSNGQILHWDGRDWSAMASPTDRYLMSIDMRSPTDGWAVGWDGALIRWDGERWTRVSHPAGNVSFDEVAFVAPDDGWIVGGSHVLHWDGTAWHDQVIENAQLECLDIVSASDIWALGGSAAQATAYHWDGGSWQSEAMEATDQILAVDMVSATDGWAGGWYKGTVLRFHGASASASPTATAQPSRTPTVTRTATATASATAVPAPVYLPILHQRWPPVPDKPQLNAINAIGDSRRFVVVWNPALRADDYVLEEANEPSFAHSTVQYRGSATTWNSDTRTMGVYYYRVKGLNGWGEGPWSNVQAVTIKYPATFPATEDATLFNRFPNLSMPHTVDMWVGYFRGACGDFEWSTTARSVVRFNVSSIPAGAPIARAALHLTEFEDPKIGDCYARAIEGQTRTVTAYRNVEWWSESSVTWNDKPDTEGRAYGSFDVRVTRNLEGDYAMDITELVAGWVNRTLPNYGLTLRGPESTGEKDFLLLIFATRERASGGPFLNVTYAGAPP